MTIAIEDRTDTLDVTQSPRVNPKQLEHRLRKSGLLLPSQVRKRDGFVVSFDIRRIERAVTRCYDEQELPPLTPVSEIVRSVANRVAAHYTDNVDIPHVEEVQDIVETALLSAGEFQAAKSYILYRDHRAQLRGREVPLEVREAFEADKQYFPTVLQQFQFYDKYSRYNWERGRRETWVETVNRVIDYLATLSDHKLPVEDYQRLRDGILNMRAMPSMRALAMAGAPAIRNSLAIYNCSYLPIADVQSFVEILLISMAGCGVGYSVESDYIDQLPRIKRQPRRGHTEVPTHFVHDSTEGWAEALRLGLTTWWGGGDIKFDFSLVRPAGTPLLTKGGRASGPEPLRLMLEFARDRILARQGNVLRPIDALDIACAIGNAAVSGGVRRTAMICLFDWWDVEVRNAKNGVELLGNEQRWNANNSAVWPHDLTQVDLVEQMIEMARGNRGEPGIFSRENAQRTKPKRRKKHKFGTNPCGEILLPPYGLCNLSIAVARREDTFEDLLDKVELATIIGTIQSLATNFPGMREEWKRNCEDERLLGVDITGQLDCPAIWAGDDRMSSADVLERLRLHAVEVNQKYAEMLGINPSAAITCNKPSGNSSQLLDCASGLHARWSEYYVRNVRVGAHTPLFRVLKEAGVPMDPENGQSTMNATTWVAHFPVRAPEAAITRKDRSAVEQCKYWLLNKKHWTEHNPSATITYEPEELLELTQWVWEHRHLIGGLTFLPASGASYSQMPYEEIDAAEYERLAGAFPEVDFARIFLYEHEDMTTAAQELACLSGQCDI